MKEELIKKEVADAYRARMLRLELKREAIRSKKRDTILAIVISVLAIIIDIITFIKK